MLKLNLGKRLCAALTGAALLVAMTVSGTAAAAPGKVLVAFYSATGSTARVAEIIARQTGGELFEIKAEPAYSTEDLDYRDPKSRVSQEYADASRREVGLAETQVPNFEDYDTVFVGYPIWWAIAAWPVSTFVKAQDFGSKKVYPFCTSASSPLGESDVLLQKQARGGQWQPRCQPIPGGGYGCLVAWCPPCSAV